MPGRFPTRTDRGRSPRPFSSEWLRSPQPQEPTRPIVTLPAWIPEERTLNAALVLVLALAIALVASQRGAPRFAASETVNRPAPVGVAPDAALTPGHGAAPLVAVGGAAAPEPAPALAAEPNDPAAVAPVERNPAAVAAPTPAPTFVPAPVVATPPPAVAAEQLPGSLLPANRILAYYGHPHDENMGILGEYSKEDLLALLLQERANYEAADPSRPVIPAFELIATVAQRTPGADGTYILDTDLATLTEYADFAEANGAIVILDLQIGRGTVAHEIEKVRPLLERPNVHLALDPEFAIAEGEMPGDHIGSLDAESIVYAQNYLARLSQEQGLPPKILIVHQFREDMIGNKMSLKPVPGVQLVIDADGFGEPELKIDVYNILVRDEPLEFAGVKLFYKQDHPLMSPAEVLALTPSPDVVIYQ